MKKGFEMNDQKATTGGLGIGTVLFLIFLTLKLAEVGPVANWSWWWVTFPLYAPILLVMVILGIIFGIAFIIALFKK